MHAFLLPRISCLRRVLAIFISPVSVRTPRANPFPRTPLAVLFCGPFDQGLNLRRFMKSTKTSKFLVENSYFYELLGFIIQRYNMFDGYGYKILKKQETRYEDKRAEGIEVKI